MNERSRSARARGGREVWTNRGAKLRATSEAERTARLAERVRAEIAELLLRGEVRDPRLSDVFVSAVTVTRDLSLAKVFVRVLKMDVEAARRDETLEALASARGHVRRMLARRLGTRTVPELRFQWDDTADRAARLDALLAEVEAERAIRREDAEEADES